MPAASSQSDIANCSFTAETNRSEVSSGISEISFGWGHGWQRLPEEKLSPKIDGDTDVRVAGGYRLIDQYFAETFKPTASIIERYRSHFDALGCIEEIVVLGHSLSDVDAPYFAEIIERVSPTTRWSVSDGPQLTHVTVFWREGEREDWLKFGKPVANRIVSRSQRIESYAAGQVFGLVRWASNDYGTVRSALYIVRAVDGHDPHLPAQ